MTGRLGAGPAARAGDPAPAGAWARRAWRRVADGDRRLHHWLDDRPARALALTLLLAAAFLTAGAVRFYPFVDDVSPATSQWDDWLYYKERALSILHGGWTIPIIAGAYEPPRGFLYNYFVAAVFAVTGENAAHVYPIQAGMLGVAVAVMYLALRRRLPPGGGVLYLAVLTLSAAVDVFWKYTGRLLSENLALVWLPFFFLAFFRALARPALRWTLAAGASLGLATLARPGLFLLAPVLGLWLGLAPVAAWRRRHTWAFLFTFGLLLSLMGVRDYAVTGRFRLSPITTSVGWTPLALGPDAAAGVAGLARAGAALLRQMGVRVLYGLGFLFVLEAKHPLAPHWIVMWTGVGAFVWNALRRRDLEAWQGVLLVFIAVALAPVILVSDIANYGIRMLLVVLPAAWALAVHAATRLARAALSDGSAGPA